MTISLVLREAVIEAAKRSDVREAVARVFADLQVQIDLRKPVCNASGRCCRFDEFGHRLYVTTLELASFVGSLPKTELGEGVAPCPFQIGGLCSVHTIRPFGCRVFFCDATATHWQQVQYERFHAILKERHEALKVPYFYVEWRWALAELGFVVRQAPNGPTNSLSLPQHRL